MTALKENYLIVYNILHKYTNNAGNYKYNTSDEAGAPPARCEECHIVVVGVPADEVLVSVLDAEPQF